MVSKGLGTGRDGFTPEFQFSLVFRSPLVYTGGTKMYFFLVERSSFDMTDIMKMAE